MLLGAFVFLGFVAFGELKGSSVPQDSALQTASASSTLATVERHSFQSRALGRSMPYTVFLPPGYGASSEAYPVLYMLHGAGGTNIEWENYHLLEQAEAMMLTGEIRPFIIVLPQGDISYWVDHYQGEAWGTYTARDVVTEIDSRYRTLQSPSSRAIGGLSMGGDGAFQLAVNFPGVFGIVGAHTPVFRPFAEAPDFFGGFEYFRAHSVPWLVIDRPDAVRELTILLDTGLQDLWLANVVAVHEDLEELGIEHRFKLSGGEHNADYWTAHVPDNLRFYSESFR